MFEDFTFIDSILNPELDLLKEHEQISSSSRKLLELRAKLELDIEKNRGLHTIFIDKFLSYYELNKILLHAANCVAVSEVEISGMIESVELEIKKRNETKH